MTTQESIDALGKRLTDAVNANTTILHSLEDKLNAGAQVVDLAAIEAATTALESSNSAASKLTK